MAEEKLQQVQSRTGEQLSLEVLEDEYGDPVIYWDEVERYFGKECRIFKNGAS
ncbi:hypothetical protein BGZ74_002803, partial [Mortierella antarctica]